MNDQEIITALQDAHRATSEAVSLLEERWRRCRTSADMAEKNRIEAILFGVNKCPWLLRQTLGMFDVTPGGEKLLSPCSSSDATPGPEHSEP